MKILQIHSSESIPVHILGNTKINPLIVQVVSISMPVLLLISIVSYSRRKKSIKKFVSVLIIVR